jgi:hypothetical protein
VWGLETTLTCNFQCEPSIFGSWIAAGGSPSYSTMVQERLFRFDGMSWLLDRSPPFYAYHVDVGRSFVVQSINGASNPVVAIQVAPFP